VKIAIISDIHANMEALEAVMLDIREQKLDKEIWCLGDIVGYGADPNPVTERIAEEVDINIAGNHDWAAVGKMTLGYFNSAAATSAEWTHDNLTQENRDWLAALPLERVERDVRLVHGSPSDPAAWHYVLSIAEAEGEMSTYDEQLCLIGHSHFLGNFEQNGNNIDYNRGERIRCQKGRRYLVNVGSVGQPRDGDPRSAYVVYDTNTKEVWHRRVPYDVESAHRKILEAGLPRFLADRLLQGT
jgi:diadenosine tetraphosphatase ApaH/serine/threonine PP2A family protein phosphatase